VSTQPNRARILSIALIAMLSGLWACGGSSSGDDSGSPQFVPGGNPARGVIVLEQFGCGSCHVIPGVRQATGLLGPPLMWWSRRAFIAGEISNSPDHLIAWIESPPSIEANTAMPALGLTEQEARDAAAYLYTLR
jgi:cytochrome c2